MTYITGGDGWDLAPGLVKQQGLMISQMPELLEGMQRSAVFNMPMAIVVAKSWSKYLELPTQHKALCLGSWVERESEVCFKGT